MTDTIDNHQTRSVPTRNVLRFEALAKRLRDCEMDDLRIGVFYGPSGYGKTTSAVSTAIKTHCHFVRMGSAWTTKRLADEICLRLNIDRRGTASAALTDIVERMTLDPGRALIIDEADYLIQKSLIDFVRDIHDIAKVPVILIGEEKLPQKLARFERAHNRVLEFVPAQPADLAEARMFAKFRAPEIALTDDLLARFVEVGEGRARRIAKNIDDAKDIARTRGLKKVGLAEWGSRPFFDAQPPKRRVA